jgi:hypothetical protein
VSKCYIRLFLKSNSEIMPDAILAIRNQRGISYPAYRIDQHQRRYGLILNGAVDKAGQEYVLEKAGDRVKFVKIAIATKELFTKTLMERAGISYEYAVACWHSLTDADRECPVLAAETYLNKLNKETKC